MTPFDELLERMKKLEETPAWLNNGEVDRHSEKWEETAREFVPAAIKEIAEQIEMIETLSIRLSKATIEKESLRAENERLKHILLDEDN